MPHARGTPGDTAPDGADRSPPTRASLILGLRRAADGHRLGLPHPAATFVVAVDPQSSQPPQARDEGEAPAKRCLDEYLADLGYSGDDPRWSSGR